MLPGYLMMVGAVPGKVYFSAEDTEEGSPERLVQMSVSMFQMTQKV